MGKKKVATFGGLLQAARLAAGLTLADLARRAGVTPDLIRKLEGGQALEPKLGTACRLALALEVPLLDLCPPVDLTPAEPARPRGRPRKTDN